MSSSRPTPAAAACSPPDVRTGAAPAGARSTAPGRRAATTPRRAARPRRGPARPAGRTGRCRRCRPGSCRLLDAHRVRLDRVGDRRRPHRDVAESRAVRDLAGTRARRTGRSPPAPPGTRRRRAASGSAVSAGPYTGRRRRRRAGRVVAAVHDEVGHVRAVVGVQVRERDGVELPRVEVALQRAEAPVPQVDQQVDVAGRDEVARGGGGRPRNAARAAQHGQAHAGTLTLGRLARLRSLMVGSDLPLTVCKLDLANVRPRPPGADRSRKRCDGSRPRRTPGHDGPDQAEWSGAEDLVDAQRVGRAEGQDRGETRSRRPAHPADLVLATKAGPLLLHVGCRPMIWSGRLEGCRSPEMACVSAAVAAGPRSPRGARGRCGCDSRARRFEDLALVRPVW